MKYIKRLLVIGVSICIANLACYGYYNPTHGSIKNTYRLEPNDRGFQAMEGIALTETDSNGFTNKDFPVEKDCILVMGSSQGSGQNVLIEERFSDQLNYMLGYEESYKVYNVCYSGGLFKDIVHNYQQLLDEFPGTNRVFIELDSGHLIMTHDDLAYALDQVGIEESVTGTLLSDYSVKDKFVFYIKEALPLALLGVKQYYAWKPLMTNISFEKKVGEKDILLSDVDCQKVEIEYWEECIRLISEQSEAEVTIVFHDPIDMNVNENTDTSLPDKMKQIEKICNKYNIDVINMIPVFSQNYLENYEVPYGFHNTQFNKGHLNKVGNRLIAEEMYKYIMEKEK